MKAKYREKQEEFKLKYKQMYVLIIGYLGLSLSKIYATQFYDCKDNRNIIQKFQINLKKNQEELRLKYQNKHCLVVLYLALASSGGISKSLDQNSEELSMLLGTYVMAI